MPLKKVNKEKESFSDFIYFFKKKIAFFKSYHPIK